MKKVFVLATAIALVCGLGLNAQTPQAPKKVVKTEKKADVKVKEAKKAEVKAEAKEVKAKAEVKAEAKEVKAKSDVDAKKTTTKKATTKKVEVAK